MKTIDQRPYIVITIVATDGVVNHPAVFGKYKLAVFPPSNGDVNDEPLFERIINITDPTATVIRDILDSSVVLNDTDISNTNRSEDDATIVSNESTITTTITDESTTIINDIKDGEISDNNYEIEIKKIVIEQSHSVDSIDELLVQNNQQIEVEKTIIQQEQIEVEKTIIPQESTQDTEPILDKEKIKKKDEEENVFIVESKYQTLDENDTITKRTESTTDEDVLLNLANNSSVPFNFGLSSSLVSSHTPITTTPQKIIQPPIKTMVFI
jgi:hypothetical protein